MVTLIAPLKRERERSDVGDHRGKKYNQESKQGKSKEGREMSCAIVEAWEIRGWSLKVREEPLSTGSSQNESCYLILLSTLLRFIRQLFDALQYAANRARIVCHRLSFFRSRYSFLSDSPSLRFRFLSNIYTSENI